MFTLYLSHLLFVSNSEEFTDELRIDSDYLDDFMPKLEKLTPHLINILHKLKRYLVWILQVDSL